MSKLSFRARALDASKPMPIYLAEELPDLPDYSAINRAVPQMPSGMEKEEESEHHLQRAISGTGLIIPTPEVCEVSDLEFYERCYPPDYKMPKQHIHMQPLWEEQEAPEYDIDSEDERWLKQQRHPELTELLFEQMMDKLEKCSGQTVVTLSEAKLLLERKDDLVIAVYDYWLNKRLNTQHPLILCVKTESRPGQSTNNPYLAFRRRTEKMQTRKNRKNDESSYEKMLKLRRDLARALTLLQLVARREQAKRDLVRLTAATAHARYAIGDFALLQPDPPPRPVYASAALPPAAFRRDAFAAHQHHYPPRAPPQTLDQPRQREKRPYKRRKHRHHAAGAPPALREGVVASSSEEESSGRGDTASPPEPGPFAFRRKPGCYYEMPTATLCGEPLDAERATDDVLFEHELDERHRYTLTSVSSPYPHCVGFARRRVARGGRVALDRVRTPLDDLWPRLAFPAPDSSQHRRDRDEEVELETKAHRSPKQLSRDYHTSGRYPWRHAFRQHFARNPHLWTEAKPKLDIDDIKMDIDDVKLDIDDIKDVLPQNSDISLRTVDEKVFDSDKVSGVSVEPSDLDSAVRENLDRVLRKRSWSGCSDSSYDSDESLYPVEREFEQFINEVNKKWLHFRPKTPPPPPKSPPELVPLARSAPFTVELRPLGSGKTGLSPGVCSDPFITAELTLADLFPDVADGVAMETDAPAEGRRGLGDNSDFLSQGQGSEPRASPGRAGQETQLPEPERLGSSAVCVRAHSDCPRVYRPPAPVVRPPTPPKKVQTPVKEEQRAERASERASERSDRASERPSGGERPAPSPVPNSSIIVEEVNEVPAQLKVEKKKPSETIEEVVLAHGVQLKTVQTRHSPLKKHIISSCAHRRDDTPHLLTVAVSDSLKVRLQNHLLSSQAGGSGATVVGLVQNGPFAPAGQVARALPQQAREPVSVGVSGASVSTGHAVSVPAAGVSASVAGCVRRVSAPLVHLAPTRAQPQQHQVGRGAMSGAPVVVAGAHTIHHVAPNKLKVLHAHPLTHSQRNQLLAQTQNRIAQLPAVVSLATLGDAKAGGASTGGGAVAQLFEIKGAGVGKAAQLLNVVRPAARRIELSGDKKRHLVATIDPAALKAAGGLTGVRGGARVNVSVDGRGLLRAHSPHQPHPQPLRHQIHLKNRTFQVATPLARGVEPGTSVASAAGGKLPQAVVANLLHKSVHLPKGGQKIAISGVGGGMVPAGVQAIALSAAQLKARPRLPHAAIHRSELVESAAAAGSSAAGGAEPSTNGAPPQPDTLPMEVT